MDYSAWIGIARSCVFLVMFFDRCGMDHALENLCRVAVTLHVFRCMGRALSHGKTEIKNNHGSMIVTSCNWFGFRDERSVTAA